MCRGVFESASVCLTDTVLIKFKFLAFLQNQHMESGSGRNNQLTYLRAAVCAIKTSICQALKLKKKKGQHYKPVT